jgi:carboxyl-terminal processing protease
VQATRPLPYNTQFKVTTAKYYIPSGRCIQAVDYTQRNEDGSISFIPDSLISEFKTQNGRTVYDGGGITPDIANQKSTYSRIASILYANNIYFDYATQFRANNSSIESPSIFSLSDAEYEDFVSYLSTVDFEYQSQTELLVNELASTAKQEKYYDLTHELIDSLASLIKENPLKDLQFFRSEIQSLLEDEIVSRYYYQSGKVRHNIKNDDLIPLSIEILNDKSKYINILSKSSEIFAKDSLQANHTNNKSISWGYHQASSSNSQAVNKKVLLPS